MTNKQLKDFFKITDVNGQIKCWTDYEITKARLHSKSHGAAADRPKQKPVRICTSAEDVAFLLDFLRVNPETVERSSYKSASCEGKKGSWIGIARWWHPASVVAKKKQGITLPAV